MNMTAPFVAMCSAAMSMTVSAVAMRCQSVNQMVEQHGREGPPAFVLELGYDVFIGFEEPLECGRPGFVQLLGVLSMPFMIVKAHDFFNGLVDGFEVVVDRC